MHLIVALSQIGKKVGSIDMDISQLSLTTYHQNREITKQLEPNLCNELTEHRALSNIVNEKSNIDNQINELNDLLNKYNDSNIEYIIIDTPAGENAISKIVHSYADIVITPINESFIDVDLLMRIKLNPETKNVEHYPGIYTNMIWQQKLFRAKHSNSEIDWIIIKNRSSHIDSYNKQKIDTALDIAAKKFGFRILKGFSERTIFRELFLKGLTLLDLANVKDLKLTPSHIAARQELREFILHGLKLKHES
jgi:chromosome partitioning protein